jgi:hypothetical protein
MNLWIYGVHPLMNIEVDNLGESCEGFRGREGWDCLVVRLWIEGLLEVGWEL